MKETRQGKASGAMGRQLLHQVVVFAALIVAALSYAETASAQDAWEEAMRNSSGLPDVASARV